MHLHSAIVRLGHFLTRSKSTVIAGFFDLSFFLMAVYGMDLLHWSFAEEALPALFEKYTQASTTHARQYGGTGLGLAICKNLVHHFLSSLIFNKIMEILKCIGFANDVFFEQ